MSCLVNKNPGSKVSHKAQPSLKEKNISRKHNIVTCIQILFTDEASLDLMWLVLSAAFCLSGIIIVTLVLHVLLTGTYEIVIPNKAFQFKVNITLVISSQFCHIQGMLAFSLSYLQTVFNDFNDNKKKKKKVLLS